MKNTISILAKLIFVLFLTTFASCEKSYLGRYFIENKTSYFISISQKRDLKIIKQFDIESNNQYEAFYMGDFYSVSDVPLDNDTIYVRFNDSTFIDTDSLQRSIIHRSTYKQYDKVVKGNNTTWFYSFTIDEDYLNILRKQIKR
jgi:hypothetical protein